MYIIRYYFQILIKLEISQQIFEKHSNIKFKENSSSRSRVVPCGQKDRQIDMPKLVVAFRNFANGSNKTDEFTMYTLFLLHLIKNLSHRKSVHTKFVDFNGLFVLPIP